jgi:CheY-like chemotaxis protein
LNAVILLVDGIVANRVTLVELLEGQGYQLVEGNPTSHVVTLSTFRRRHRPIRNDAARRQ